MCDGVRKRAQGKVEGGLVIISAPSGAGKTTIVERLVKQVKWFRRSISYTTRKPRAGEVNGKDYFFITRREFLKKRAKSFFLEWASVFGEYYGTSETLCIDWVRNGFHVILTIDVQGMRKIKRRLKKVIPLTAIFIAPPSLSVLKERLTHRKTDSAAEISKRLQAAKEEMKAKREYDFVVVNRNVNGSVKQIKKILK